MSKRFYHRYHPIFVLRKPKHIYSHRNGRPIVLKNELEDADFKLSYLLDAQSMLYPPMTTGKILEKLINTTDIDILDLPTGWKADAIRKQHFEFVYRFIWNKIKCLAKTIAATIVLKKSQMACAMPARRAERPAKRPKTVDVLSTALDIQASDEKQMHRDEGMSVELAVQMVEAEIQILKGIGASNTEAWPKTTGLCAWWARQKTMPCLMQAALAILANKPSSGGLECDLGALSDVLDQKDHQCEQDWWR